MNISCSIEEPQKKLNKIKNYKGNVIANWKWELPQNEKEAIIMLRKSIRLFYRALDCGFLIGDLVTALQKYVTFLSNVASVMLVAYPEIILGIRDIKNYKLDNTVFEVKQEKIRERVPARCSLCKTSLVYPAYVIKRQGDKIISVSKAIGIKCLTTFTGKLRDLVNSFEIQEFFINNTTTERNTNVNKAKCNSNYSQLTLF